MGNLSKDYHFYWDADSKSRKAYTAVTNQGNTADFSRTVWNTLVDNLYMALLEVDLDWDSTYGSYLSTRANIIYANLTSDRFNAVRLNISKYIHATWKWQYDPNFQGYIGREEMHGVDDVGESRADTVYGSYILELVRKYNVFIDILDGEASFAQFVSNVAQGISMTRSELEKIPTAQCNVDEVLYSIFDTVLTVSRSYGISANLVDRTSSVGSHIGLFEPEDCFKSTVRGRTSYSATIELEDLCIEMTVFLMARMTSAVNLAITANKSVLRSEAINYSVSEALLVHALTSDMVSQLRSTTDQEVILGLSIPLSFNINHIESPVIDADFAKDRPRYLIFDDTFKATFDCEMENVTSRDLMSTIIGMFRYTRSALVALMPQRLLTNTLARTVANGQGEVSEGLRIPPIVISSSMEEDSTLEQDPSLQISGGTSGQESDNSTATAVPLVRLVGDMVQAKGEVSGAIVELPGINTSSTHSEIMNVIGELIRARITYFSGSLDSNFTIESCMEAYQEGGHFFIDISALQTSVSELTIKEITDSLIVNHVLVDTVDGEIEFCIPSNLTTVTTFIDSNTSLMEIRDAEDSIYPELVLIEEEGNALLESIRTVNFESIVQCESHQESSMEFDPSSWLNPVKENEKLNVYQVYSLEQEDGVLYLDKKEETE